MYRTSLRSSFTLVSLTFNLCMFLFKLYAHSIHVTLSMCFGRPSYTALHSMKSTTVLINLYLTVSSGDDRNILKVYVAGREVFPEPRPPRPGAFKNFFCRVLFYKFNTIKRQCPSKGLGNKAKSREWNRILHGSLVVHACFNLLIVLQDK